jgi:hypothetical protein
LRERDPRDLCRTGGHSELLRPAPITDRAAPGLAC